MSRLTGVVLFFVVCVSASPVAAQNTCNGSVTMSPSGGSTSSCPSLSQTWRFQIDGTTKCNDINIGRSDEFLDAG